jgi:hypothetical protein
MTKVIKKQSRLFFRLGKLGFLFILLLPMMLFSRIFSVNHKSFLKTIFSTKLGSPHHASADAPSCDSFISNDGIECIGCCSCWDGGTDSTSAGGDGDSGCSSTGS